MSKPHSTKEKEVEICMGDWLFLFLCFCWLVGFGFVHLFVFFRYKHIHTCKDVLQCKEIPCLQFPLHMQRSTLGMSSLQGTSHIEENLSFLPNKGGRKSLWLMQQMEAQEIYVHILLLPQASCVTLGKSPSLSLHLPPLICKMGKKWPPVLMGLRS